MLGLTPPAQRASAMRVSPISDAVLCALPESPVPPGARTGYITTPDGVRLRYAHWPARPGTAAKGTITILTGRTEFIEKYYEVVTDLTARGFAVATFDWRGQGDSERLLRNRLKGHIANFRDYQTDLEAFVKQVLFPDCPAPHFALCHSMGAVIALESIVAGHRWFDRMVLLAPMLAIRLGRGEGVARALSALLRPMFGSFYIPGARNRPITERPFATNPVTRDERRYKLAADMVRAHPHLALGAPTIAWLRAAFDAMDRLAQPEVVRGIRQPLLLIGSDDDRVVSTRAIERLSARLIAGGHVIIAGARHELLMERDGIREQTFAAMDAFLPGSA